MGKLTFTINVTLDGCVDHREAVADAELHEHFTRLMDGAESMLFGRVTYEMMESYWPSVARDEKAPADERDWAQKLDRKRKYVVSRTRHDFHGRTPSTSWATCARPSSRSRRRPRARCCSAVPRSPPSWRSSV
jgi:dihydrofolate reductase